MSDQAIAWDGVSMDGYYRSLSRDGKERVHRLRARTGCYTEASLHACRLFADDADAIAWIRANFHKPRFWHNGRQMKEVAPGHWKIVPYCECG